MMLPDAIALLHRRKHRTTSAAVRVVPAMLAAAVLLACGKSDGNRILGHWRAERFVAQGISVPMGPEFEITPMQCEVRTAKSKSPFLPSRQRETR